MRRTPQAPTYRSQSHKLLAKLLLKKNVPAANHAMDMNKHLDAGTRTDEGDSHNSSVADLHNINPCL
jgi:hypothetical protein